MTLQNGGNVGIGGVAPTTRLDIASVSTIASGTWGGGTNFVRLLATTGSAFSEQAIAFQEGTTNVGAKIGVKNQANGAYDIIFANRDNSSTTSTLVERMRIAATGQISMSGMMRFGYVDLGTVTTDAVTIPATGNVFKITNNAPLTGASTTTKRLTITLPAVVAGMKLKIIIRHALRSTTVEVLFATPALAATGIRWPANTAFVATQPGTVVASTDPIDIVEFDTDGTNWYGRFDKGYVA